MDLKKLTLHGFKSFADKTELEFGDGITIIVGPNGCGKSNIVDAVKWVLGEQSAKSLRGGQMVDVIFNGSSTRKSMGVAEVSLHFGNTRGMLNCDEDEVVVTRRLYRSGESEYLLNKQICRLKDVREMFMDTGVGADTYSVIEQGKVELLLQSSKQDRRAIFEEAAGIVKYKSRKREAYRKLERTEQNVFRLSDVIGEIEKRLRSIRYQAGKARKYQTYTARLNELRLGQFLFDYERLERSRVQSREELVENEEELSRVSVSGSQVDARLGVLDETIDQTNQAIRSTENQQLQCTSQIEASGERIEMFRHRREEQQSALHKGRDELRAGEQEKQRFEEQIQDYQSVIEELEAALQKDQKELSQWQHVRQQDMLQLTEYRGQLEDEKSGFIDIVRRTAQLHNEINSCDQQRNSLTGQKDRLEARSGKICGEIESHLRERAQLDEKHSELESLLVRCQEQLEAKRGQVGELKEKKEQLDGNLDASKAYRIGLESRQEVLMELEANLEGLGRGVQEILKAKRENAKEYYYVKGMVAELIETDVAYATIVEAALGGKAEQLVVSDSSDLLAASDHLRELPGRVEMICPDLMGPFQDGYDFSTYPEVQGRLIEMVRFSPEHEGLAWQLLGKTVLVDSIESAVRLSREVPAGYRWVTAAGEVLEADGTVRIGPAGPQAGLISRKSESREITENLVEVQERIQESQNAVGQVDGQIDHLEKNLQELRTSMYENKTELIQAKSRIEQIDENLNRLKQEQPLISSEMAEFEDQIQDSLQREASSKENLSDLQAINDQRQGHIAELGEIIGQLETKEQSLQDQITELKVSISQRQQQRSGLAERVQETHHQLNQILHKVGVMESERVKAEEDFAVSEQAILSAESQLAELYLTRQRCQEQAGVLRGQRDSQEEEKTELHERSKTLAQQKEQLQEHLHEIQMGLSENELRLETVIQRSREELDVDVAAEYRNRVEGDGATSGERVSDFAESGTAAESSDIEQDWEQVSAEISDLKEKIARLGNVNLDAISEQEELEERAGTLKEQVDDLESSRKQLEDLIVRLNEISREKFQVSFEAIKENFSELFRKLFGGGRAEIILEDPDDILECDIEILARPPGKQQQSLSLLSGGEKTLTAIGLLLAIFKSKPSPFCILDEADAALDEANNERYNLVLQECLRESQVIIITHSRRTMTIADVLYGITMEEEGVSKRVAAKFEGYREVAEPVDKDTIVVV